VAEGTALVARSETDGVLLLTLTAPPANCYSYEMMQALDAAVLEARMNPAVHVLVLRGAGERFFCAGANINSLREATPQSKYAFCLHANETLLRLEQTPKLVIAALNGHCVGGGFEVALACDLRLARRNGGSIGLPEVNLGVLPGTGGTQRLARLVGRARALEMMALGTTVPFDEGETLGLVTRILDGPDFEAEVLAYARQFCPPAKAAKAVGLIKRAVVSGADLPLPLGLALERELQQQLFESADAREGIAAFLEKRPPRFAGR
jgi:enoyl-CoA hydratase/carnithine racemase